MYLHLLTFLERARCKRARARAPVSFLRLRQEKNRLVMPAMHEKLSNTMTKLEAVLDTVTKDLRYKFAVPVPRSRPRRPLPTDRHRSTCTGWDLLTVSGVALSFVVVLSSSRLEGGAGSAVVASASRREKGCLVGRTEMSLRLLAGNYGRCHV